MKRLLELKSSSIAEAEAWVLEDSDGVFRFLNIREALGIDGEALRERVRERSAEKQRRRRELLNQTA